MASSSSIRCCCCSLRCSLERPTASDRAASGSTSVSRREIFARPLSTSITPVHSSSFQRATPSQLSPSLKVPVW